MRNRMYGGVRGRKTKVGEKLLRFPPTRLFFLFTDTKSLKNIFIYNKAQTFTSSGFAFPQKICIFAENFFKYGKDTNKI